MSAKKYFITEEGDDSKPGNQFLNTEKKDVLYYYGNEISSLKEDLSEIRNFQEKEFANVHNSINKLSETILSPENGLYTRIKFLESSKNVLSKVIWIAITALTTFFVSKYLLK